jgi:hypothetical protein
MLKRGFGYMFFGVFSFCLVEELGQEGRHLFVSCFAMSPGI